MQNILEPTKICWSMSLSQALNCWIRIFLFLHQTKLTLIGPSRLWLMHHPSYSILKQGWILDCYNNVSLRIVALLSMDHNICPLQKGFLGFWISDTIMSFTREWNWIQQTQWNGMHHNAVHPRRECLEQEIFCVAPLQQKPSSSSERHFQLWCSNSCPSEFCPQREQGVAVWF